MEPKPDHKPQPDMDMKIAIERMLEYSNSIIDLCDQIVEEMQETVSEKNVKQNRSRCPFRNILDNIY